MWTEEQRHAYAVALGKMPKRKRARVCEMCPNTFEGTARAKYCSRRCAAKAYRERKKIGAGAPEHVREVRET